jgi:hypothetical protein
LVGDGNQAENFAMSDAYEIRGSPVSRGHFIRPPRGSCFSCERRGNRIFKRRPPERSPIRCEPRLQQSRELAAKTRMNLLRESHPVNANFPSTRLRLPLYSPNGKP